MVRSVSASSPENGPRPPDRRARRRQQTLDEILERALQIMAEDGVAALTVTRLAKAMAIQPPSLYKYFASALAVQDALFRRGQQENLEVLRTAMAAAEPGLARVGAGMQATGRWAVDHQVLAQLLFWRPVPGYTPSADAMAPTVEIVALLRGALGEAVARDEVGPDATSDEAMALLSSMHFGVISQHLANDADSDWDHGRFTSLHPRIVPLFVSAYPPAGTSRRRRGRATPAESL